MDLQDFKSDVLKVARIAFGSAVLAGVSLFLSNPVETAQNPAFQIKMILIFLAVSNTLVFHWSFRKKSALDAKGNSASQAKVHALLSLFLWASVVTAGRWIAYV